MLWNPTPVQRVAATLALAIGGALVLSLTLAACNDSHSAAPPTAAHPTTVGVFTVQPERLALSTELPGRTTAPLVAEIRPQVSGIVKERRFIEGARVRAGQVLYQIDPASHAAAFASAQALAARAQVTLDAARLTAQRKAELARIDAISQQDNQDAQAAVVQAQADLLAAQAAVRTAHINLDRTTVTAPIGGLVDVSTVTVGALVTADQATALTTVRQTDPIQVDITQSSADVLRLKRELAAGQLQRLGNDEARVTLLLEDGSRYARTGKLRFNGVSVNTGTGAVTLRAVFDNPDGLLMPGMYVRAVLDTGVAAQALLVPQQALSRDASGAASVLVVDAQNKVSRRALMVDHAVGDRWRVTAGLQSGERVIVEGSQKVRPGDAVQAEGMQAASAQPVAAASVPAAITTAAR